VNSVPQHDDFDLSLEDEPFHSLQIYVNLDTSDFLIRVWGKTKRKGSVTGVGELQLLCEEVFDGTVACAGHLVSEHNTIFGGDFFFVDFPCHRQISKHCELFYKSGGDEEKETLGVGLCVRNDIHQICSKSSIKSITFWVRN
jgi:hypothetical protein